VKRMTIVTALVGLVCLLTFNFSALAQNSDGVGRLQLTENQQNILRAHGLTDEQISDIDLETIREVLREGIVVDPSKFIKEKPKYSEQKIPENLKTKLNEKGLTSEKIDTLRNLGFGYPEMLKLDSSTINKIFSPDVTIQSSPPPGYQYVETVPDGGGTDEWFHPDVDVDQNSINWYVDASKQCAKALFDESDTSKLDYSYYLYGEWDSSIGTHEGVDMDHSNGHGRPVKTVTPGEVIRIVSSLGAVQIYDDYLEETITYMHMQDIDDYVAVGDIVSVGDVIGEQGSVGAYGAHVHFQAYDGRSYSIPSGRDNDLLCRIPYGFMTWYL